MDQDTVVMGDDDEEDAKPAAQPSPSNENAVEQGNDDTPDAMRAASPENHQHSTEAVTGELPFLVTHWLSGYTAPSTHAQQQQPVVSEEEQAAALQKIQRAASELSSAFATLGAFGSAPRLALQFASHDSVNETHNNNNNSNPLTYQDMKRTWSSCPTNQLQHLLQSHQSATTALDRAVQTAAEPNHVHASTETLQQALHKPDEQGGRTLQDAIVLDSNDGGTEKNSSAAEVVSALQAPVLFVSDDTGAIAEKGTAAAASTTTVAVPTRSCVTEYSRNAATAMRHYLDTRTKCQEEETRIRSLQRSLELQRTTIATLQQDQSELLLTQQNGGNDETALTMQLDEIKASQQNCERVIAQLELQLPALQRTHQATAQEVDAAREASTRAFAKTKLALQNYRDPVGGPQLPAAAAGAAACLFLNNRILLNVSHQRELGIERSLGRGMPRAMGRIRPAGATLENRKALLHNRFSYAATINAHLSYPVYCLRFDRTGRYFISGADDYLVKVFCMGGSVDLKKRGGRMDPASYARGAVLVCTLKGHAGVINDIGVSSDNCFLATASEDGDCRVWGLSDGCPVAILRGHAGGANMVSWSTLTPYRLVTTGADGLARTWDVREACLKRYGKMIGERPEYLLQLQGKDVSSEDENDSDGAGSSGPNGENGVAIPPLPVRGENGSENAAAPAAAPAEPLLPVIPPPPLPLPAAGGPNGNQNQANGVGNADIDGADAGEFVANDNMDAGVKLVSKLQHGATLDERLGGPGTRSRRSAVKVICVARCPYGGHFATGSDDGICRVWQEEDNSSVETVDSHFCEFPSTEKGAPTRTSRRTMSDRLLFTFKGHLSSITDLKYSNQGDRLLTASQKDGVVRLWSWNTDPALMASVPSSSNQPRDNTNRGISHILLKLSNPKSLSSGAARQGPRARANRNQSPTISCDCAVWVQDDSKVVTSQSEPVKQNGTEIVPGSQYLFLWDSASGHCLLGIDGGHTAQCPVVLPHPMLPSIICSAGADGTAKLWDWETGKCLYSHSNTGDFGPIEANERGKSCGYLDGDFSPEGTSLVLADDSGRITVFDSSVSRRANGDDGTGSAVVAFPDWMKEQYFSNDYYDLFYDSHGYCVERGSEMPPHLAPRGARCTHSGSPFSALVNETFKGITGPIPLDEYTARWHRLHVRETAIYMRERSFGVKGNLVRQYDPKTSRMIQSVQLPVSQSTEALASAGSAGSPLVDRTQTTTAAAAAPRSAQRLSSNYRWIGHNDMQEDDDQEPDHESDDEDFELNESRRGARARARAAAQDSDSEDLDADEMEEEVEPSRVSSRQIGRRQVTEEDEESDLEFVEFMSTNNHPTGPFVADYNAHFFKMNTGAQANRVKRRWTRRNESTSSFEGRKKYTPQIGDSIVYIPRAHYETIANFPSLETPWQSWPEEAAWPVVRCLVRNIRYRLPFKDFWNSTGGSQCESVVAKLTLEVTGIPELSDRNVGWPAPSFTNPTRTHVFELSVFEYDNSDFIVPLELYVSRLRQLETAVADTDQDVPVEAFFAEEESAIEDSEFASFAGLAIGFSEDPDNGQELSHPSLSGSGFSSVRVVWHQGGGEDILSPWEVSVRDAEPPERPKLDENEKTAVRRALRDVRGLPRADEYFRYPVNESYSDYPTRVEVPMDFTFITNRLEADYYSTKYSVVADVRLIHTNCAKYNGDNDELTALAAAVVAKFEENVLDEEERAFFHKYDAPLSGSLASLEETSAAQVDAPSASAVIQRRSQRQRQPPRSILEDVSEPVGESTRSRSTRTGLRVRLTGRRGNFRQQQSDSSVLEAVAQREVAPTLEQLSSNGRSRGRSTRTRRNNQQAAAQGRSMPQRSARTGLRNPVYQDLPSDIDEEMEIDPSPRAAAARSTRRSTARRQLGSHSTASSRPPLRPGLRSSGSQDLSSSDEDELDTHEPALASSTRATRRSTGQEFSRNTRTRKSARRAEPADDDESAESSDDDEGGLSPSPQRRSARGSSRGLPRGSRRGRSRKRHSNETEDATSSEEQDANGSEFDEEESKGNDGSSGDEAISAESSFESESEIANTTRRSTRRRGSRSRAVKAESDEESEESVPSKNNSSRRRHDEGPESPFRNAHARSTQKRGSYIDPSESEFGSDVESPPIDTRRTKKPKTSNKKRKAPKSSGPPRKRRKAQIEQRNAQIEEAKQSLNLSSWSEIPVAHISKVTIEVLERLSTMDEGGNFAIPVIEAFPEITDDYLARVPNPMDFRTIQEERLQLYHSIHELQDDLILVFSNCMNYNIPGSDLYLVAQTMMEALEQTFVGACDDLRVRRLHHR